MPKKKWNKKVATSNVIAQKKKKKEKKRKEKKSKKRGNVTGNINAWKKKNAT